MKKKKLQGPAASPVYWMVQESTFDRTQLIHGSVGMFSASLRAPMRMTLEQKCLTKRWMEAAENTLIRMALRFEDYEIDIERIQRLLLMMQAGRPDRYVRYAGNWMPVRSDTIGHLFVIDDGGQVSLADVEFDGDETSIVTQSIESEFELIDMMDSDRHV